MGDFLDTGADLGFHLVEVADGHRDQRDAQATVGRAREWTDAREGSVPVKERADRGCRL